MLEVRRNVLTNLRADSDLRSHRAASIVVLRKVLSILARFDWEYYVISITGIPNAVDGR